MTDFFQSNWKQHNNFKFFRTLFNIIAVDIIFRIFYLSKHFILRIFNMREIYIKLLY